jgi:predicted SprT family Zn-dependent metalloprotease
MRRAAFIVTRSTPKGAPVHEGGTYLTRSDIYAVIDAARARLGYKPDLTFTWSRRMISAMGKARLRHAHIVLSLPLFYAATPEKRRQTIVHEVCHFVAAHRHNDWGHGPAWMRCMLVAGETPDRCHNVDRSAAGITRPAAVCARCAATLYETPRRIATLRRKAAERPGRFWHRCADSVKGTLRILTEGEAAIAAEKARAA